VTTPTRHIVTATEAREILRDPTRERMAGQTASLAYTVIALSEQIAELRAKTADAWDDGANAAREWIAAGAWLATMPMNPHRTETENGSDL
jgi:hypothetical protein